MQTQYATTQTNHPEQPLTPPDLGFVWFPVVFLVPLFLQQPDVSSCAVAEAPVLLREGLGRGQVWL